MDVFCEYMVERKKDIRDRIYGAICVLTVILLSITLFIFLFGRLMGFEMLVFAAGWYVAIKLLEKTNIEYEYILTNNILDIDKIMSKRTRKRVISVDIFAIDECCHADEKDKSVNFKSMNLSGDLYSDDVYFIDFTKDGAKCRLFFSPNKRILNELKSLNPKKVTI